jgi:translation elongation factor EF-1alpha
MPDETEIGRVASYYSSIMVAAIELKAPLAVGDKIYIKGHTTDFEQKVDSMQIEHKSVKKAKKGDSVGIKVRPNDLVYRKQ